MRQFIFSINSGRSGSDYLYRLLSTAENATAFHEPPPSMSGSRISKAPATNPTLVDHLWYPVLYAKKYKKIQAIRRSLKQIPPDHAYIETNHMFILTFYDVVMNHFKDVHVVFLRRYMPWVVKSFLDLGMFVPGDAKTKYWTTSPNSPSAVVDALAPDDEMDQVDRCIAYVIDIEGRAQRFMQRYPKTNVVEKRLPDLNRTEHVEDVFSRLKLQTTDQTWKVMGHVSNDKVEEKPKDHSEEFCRDRILQYIEKCEAKGIEIPHLPHLDPSFKDQHESIRAGAE